MARGPPPRPLLYYVNVPGAPPVLRAMPPRPVLPLPAQIAEAVTAAAAARDRERVAFARGDLAAAEHHAAYVALMERLAAQMRALLGPTPPPEAAWRWQRG